MTRDGYETRGALSTFLSMADLFSKCSEKSQSLGGIWNDTNGTLRSATGISLSSNDFYVVKWISRPFFFLASLNIDDSDSDWKKIENCLIDKLALRELKDVTWRLSLQFEERVRSICTIDNRSRETEEKNRIRYSELIDKLFSQRGGESRADNGFRCDAIPLH